MEAAISQKVSSHHPPPPPRWRQRVQAPEGRPMDVSGDPKTAEDLMTREVLTIEPDTPIDSLEQAMDRFRFRHLPVVEGDRLVGLITHSDLLHLSSSLLSKHAVVENRIIHSLPAVRVMRREVVTVSPSDPLDEVARTLWQTRVGCLPVTEDDGTLVGIITEGDFIRLSHHFLKKNSPSNGDETSATAGGRDGETAVTSG
jgi:CBS domain-containing membrane protein